jgi:hypothetical protein
MRHISPMYYSVQAYYAELYGSTSQIPFIWSMVAIGAVTIVINIILAAALHKRKAKDDIAGNETEAIKATV